MPVVVDGARRSQGCSEIPLLTVVEKRLSTVSPIVGLTVTRTILFSDRGLITLTGLAQATATADNLLVF